MRRIREAYEALRAGRFAEARDAAAPVRSTPSGAVLHALGLAGAGDVEAGADALHAVRRANPTARPPVLDLVDLLAAAGRPWDAAPHLRAALARVPDDRGLLVALAANLAETGPAEEAAALFGRVAAANPLDADAQANHGKSLAAVGRFDEADAAFARAPPGDPQRDLNRAVARLRSGDLAGGWPLFRARHALPGRMPPPPGRELAGLDGLAGRRVLLLHDEGFGDTLQFIRYAPMLAERGAVVRVVVPDPLHRLLEAQGLSVLGRAEVAGAGFDLWCRIPDLPAVFGTGLDTIPGTLPYIRVPEAAVRWWRDRLPPGRRVGLAWAGAARPGNAAALATDRIRSIPRDRLAPLLSAPGVQWVSLQLGSPAPPGIADPMPGVQDFLDTAAIVANLDLVVTVDTSVAHLAAAMGTRVLLLDRFDNCWRWLHGRQDSPWYPGAVRIVRQDTPGDWGGVLARAAAIIGSPGSWPSWSWPG